MLNRGNIIIEKTEKFKMINDEVLDSIVTLLKETNRTDSYRMAVR